MSIAWGGPSSASASVATIRSVERYRCWAAPRKRSSMYGSGPRYMALPRGVGHVHVHERGVHRERRHGDELLAVVERRGDHPHPVVVAEDVGAEPDTGRQERHPPGGGLQAEQEHALVVGLVLDGPGLAGGAEVRLERDRVERHEGVDEALHLAGRAEDADVGAAPADHGEVGEVRAQDLAHDAHRLAARPPAAEPHGHARPQLGDGVGLGDPLVLHRSVLTSRCRCRAWRRRRRGARRRRR